jgi:hypothetical protein
LKAFLTSEFIAKYCVCGEREWDDGVWEEILEWRMNPLFYSQGPCPIKSLESGVSGCYIWIVSQDSLSTFNCNTRPWSAKNRTRVETV